MYEVDHTHDPKLNSWVESANDPNSDLPIQNLPFCVFRLNGSQASIGVGIGDQILSLRGCAEIGLLEERWAQVATQETLNQIMALSLEEHRDLRHTISSLLFVQTLADRVELEKALFYQSDVDFCLPCQIGDYSDFYASVYHATNVGSMFRPDNPLLPNYKHIPIGYHGRRIEHRYQRNSCSSARRTTRACGRGGRPDSRVFRDARLRTGSGVFCRTR